MFHKIHFMHVIVITETGRHRRTDGGCYWQMPSVGIKIKVKHLIIRKSLYFFINVNAKALMRNLYTYKVTRFHNNAITIITKIPRFPRSIFPVPQTGNKIKVLAIEPCKKLVTCGPTWLILMGYSDRSLWLYWWEHLSERHEK